MYLIKNNHMDKEVIAGDVWTMSYCLCVRSAAITKKAPIIYTAGEKNRQKNAERVGGATTPESRMRQENGLVNTLQEWRSLPQQPIHSAIWTEENETIGVESIKATVWEINDKYMYDANLLGWILYRLGWGVQELITQGRIAVDASISDWHVLLLYDTTGTDIVGVLMGLLPKLA